MPAGARPLETINPAVWPPGRAAGALEAPLPRRSNPLPGAGRGQFELHAARAGATVELNPHGGARPRSLLVVPLVQQVALVPGQLVVLVLNKPRDHHDQPEQGRDGSGQIRQGGVIAKTTLLRCLGQDGGAAEDGSGDDQQRPRDHAHDSPRRSR